MLKVKNENLSLNKLKDRLTIAIISDIHLKHSQSKKLLKTAIKIINKKVYIRPHLYL